MVLNQWFQQHSGALMDCGRSSGVLLHPTSLPGPGGIGELGSEARWFVDWLQSAGQSRWQVLPLGPTGYADSPYASFSSFAGNPLLISPEGIEEWGALERENAAAIPPCDPDRVDFAAAMAIKQPMLRAAAVFFLEHATEDRRRQFSGFCADQAFWLDDFSLFMAVKEVFQKQADARGTPLCTWYSAWDRDIARREPAAMERWKQDLADEIAIHQVLQFFFFGQWLALKRYANERGVQIIGDLPIFVAGDSSDVWADPGLFLLNPDGSPEFVAGVPPDFFAVDGQNWGNPQYNWTRMAGDRFAWWIRRFRGTAALVDRIRVDHFRGFESSYFIPGREATGRNGTWTSVPGQQLFRELRRQLGELPLIAEDLGVITKAVDDLRDEFGFPGMRILQFAFEDGDDRSRNYLPHHHIRNCVVYTGTHDNDTVVGWYRTRPDAVRQRVDDYLGGRPEDVAWEFIRLALSSVADTAIVPMQDLLGLDSRARMNTPGTGSGNWGWRMRADYREVASASRLAHLSRLYDRCR